MEIISRAQWGARAPRGRPTVAAWSSRTGFVVHYSAANRSQTVKAIQNYHMDTNGWSDVGYNFLVDTTGRIYEGRGWSAVGAHTALHNLANIGVCMIGTDADVTEAAKRAIRWLYDEACRRAGRTLAKRYHSLLGNTACPGPTLRAWVIAGMPIASPPAKPTPNPKPPKGDDVALSNDDLTRIARAVWDIDYIPAARPPNHNHDYDSNKEWRAKYTVQVAVEASRAAVAEVKALRAEIAARPEPGTVTVSDDQLERVLRRIVASLGEAK